MSFQDILIDVIDTNATKKPDSPQFKFTNPLKKNIFVNSIQLSFDAYFSEKGSILIKINNNPILSKKAGSFKRLENFTVPMQNQEFFQQQKIEIFAWNGSGDSDFVSVGHDIQISEDPNASVSLDAPLSQLIRNSAISDDEELFPFRVFSDESPTKLIDMKGHKKLIVTMSASSIPAITEETPASTSNFSPTSGLLFDFTQTPSTFVVTSLPILGGLGESYDIFQVVDLGRSEPQSLTFDIDEQLTKVVRSITHYDSCSDSQCDGSFQERHINQIKVVTYDVDESDDLTFTTGVTNIETGVSNVSEPLATTKRYIRITEHITTTYANEAGADTGFQNNNGQGQGDISGDFTPSRTPSIFTNWLDGLTVGGQADLSFEILGSNGQWIQLIGSAEFGTVTSGDTVIAQIGDVVSRDGTDKVGFILPSTQTNFRAKLTVVNAIETGVTILKVI